VENETRTVAAASGEMEIGDPQALGGRRRCDYQPLRNELVLLRWDPTTTRIARFVRFNGAGNPVVQVERVAANGSRMEGYFGAPRCFRPEDVLGPAGVAPGSGAEPPTRRTVARGAEARAGAPRGRR
jgi:hypothetical protein